MNVTVLLKNIPDKQKLYVQYAALCKVCGSGEGAEILRSGLTVKLVVTVKSTVMSGGHPDVFFKHNVKVLGTGVTALPTDLLYGGIRIEEHLLGML